MDDIIGNYILKNDDFHFNEIIIANDLLEEKIKSEIPYCKLISSITLVTATGFLCLL